MCQDVRPKVLEVRVLAHPDTESADGDTGNRPNAENLVEETIDAEQRAETWVVAMYVGALSPMCTKPG